MYKMTIKEYALKHKLSIFNVVKMTKSGTLATELIKENEKEVLYILLDDVKEEQITEQIITHSEKEPYSLRKENTRLKEEILNLKEEIKELKKQP